jgi:hypothetical protein
VAPAKRATGHLRNGKQEPVGKTRDSRDLPAIVSQPAVHVNPLINLNKLAHVHLDPAALRPTRKTKFTWNPLNKTLRITKVEGGRRAAEWVGLRFKAQGLKKWASNVDESRTHGSSVLTSSEPQVNGCPSVDASSCSDVSDTASEPRRLREGRLTGLRLRFLQRRLREGWLTGLRLRFLQLARYGWIWRNRLAI